MREKKTDILEQRIELFCKSSQELLTGINNKHSCDTKPKKKRKKRKNITVNEPDVNMMDRVPLDELV